MPNAPIDIIPTAIETNLSILGVSVPFLIEKEKKTNSEFHFIDNYLMNIKTLSANYQEVPVKTNISIRIKFGYLCFFVIS